MIIFSVILGILMIIGGICCMFTPLTTFLSTGYFMSIMLLFYGIAGIVRYFMQKGKVLEIVVSGLAIVVGLISLFVPGTSLVFDAMMLAMIAAWFLVQSIVSIVLAFKLRKVDDLWFIGLIAGILGVIMGIYSFLHPQMLALSSGMLIGFFFIETGISTIVMGTVLNKEEN